jgi:ornithine cyclodeaminase/alanine dehydrogenase-like protein (mu-crystallin family)
VPAEETLLLRRSDVERLLTLGECIEALENAFRLQGEGKISGSEILGVRSENGGLHVKAGFLPGAQNYFVAKLNCNFPGNNARFGLPTIQGVIFVADAKSGSPLALLDSIDITTKRTAAATAVAARYLARQNSTTLTICGCGAQGRAQLAAIRLVLPLDKVFVFDANESAAKNFAAEFANEVDIQLVRDLTGPVSTSDVIITCTSSREFFLRKQDVKAGTFVAAVGADDAYKQEIDPALMASVKIVADSLNQCCAIGDTHHAIVKGLMNKEDVHAELPEIVAGQKPGRIDPEEIIIFDSTGVAIEDAVAAAAIYEKARAANIGTHFKFAV